MGTYFRYQIPNVNRTIKFCELLMQAPHILIGGTTGSGKSTFIDDFVYSILTTKVPAGVSFVWIDPKRVDLVQYRDLPHTQRYVTENRDILRVLDEVIATMESRYRQMNAYGKKEFDGTRIVVVIDELADLMTTCKKEILPKLQRIAQLGRASKIMLVCATQCPNRRIIPAELTLNFGGRVALRCTSAIESRQIINRAGAELLPEHGKALYFHVNGKYYELDVPLLPQQEISRVIAWWVNQKHEAEAQIVREQNITKKDTTEQTSTRKKNWRDFFKK